MWYLLIFILVSGCVWLVGYAVVVKPQFRLHLDDGEITTLPKRRSLKDFSVLTLLNKVLKPFAVILRPVVGKVKYLQKLKTQAEILRINLDLPLLLAIKIVLTVSFGIIGFNLLLKMSPWYVLLAILIGFFLPDYLMWQKIRGKKEEIVHCFPETVDLLDMCINAGADFISAIKWIIEKSNPNPFIEQMAIVLSEIQVGKPRGEALRTMAKRLQLPDISSFSRAIVQAERMGTSIEEAFRNLSDDTRDRRYQNGERYAIKASLKMLIPLLFCILPSIMIVVAGPIILKFMQGGLMPAAAPM